VSAVIQFTIPRLAADIVNVETLRDRGRELGVDDDRFTYSYTRAGVGCRVTCSMALAGVLAQQFRDAITTATDPEIRKPLEMALAAVLEEVAIGPHDAPKS